MSEEHHRARMAFLGGALNNLHIPSIGGMKKQFSKADQLVTQKISGTEGSKLDDDFSRLEKATDIYIDLQAEMQVNTREMLYPNPTVRAKMFTDKGISTLGVGVPNIPTGGIKGMAGVGGLTGQVDPDRALSDAMEKGGKKMIELYQDTACPFGDSLTITGESFGQLGDMRKSMEENVTQNYLTPLEDVQTRDLNEVARLRKKVAGHKLDYDCKKRHGAQGGELQDAERKFADSYKSSQVQMNNVLVNDAEYIMQLAALSSSLNDYHSGCVTILEDLVKQLKVTKGKAERRPRQEFNPRSLFEMTGTAPSSMNKNLSLDTGGQRKQQGGSKATTPQGSPWGSPVQTPSHGGSRPPSRPVRL